MQNSVTMPNSREMFSWKFRDGNTVYPVRTFHVQNCRTDFVDDGWTDRICSATCCYGCGGDGVICHCTTFCVWSVYDDRRRKFSVAIMSLFSVSYNTNLISIAHLSKILSPHENLRWRVLEFRLTTSHDQLCLSWVAWLSYRLPPKSFLFVYDVSVGYVVESGQRGIGRTHWSRW
jgi:hypothetical protein